MRRILSTILLASLLWSCTDQSKQSAIQLANTSYLAGDYAAAMFNVKNALVNDPDDTSARILYAGLLVIDGRYSAAERELERADFLDSKALHLLARIYYKTARPIDVISLYTTHEEVLDASDEIKFYLHNAYVQSSQVDLANALNESLDSCLAYYCTLVQSAKHIYEDKFVEALAALKSIDTSDLMPTERADLAFLQGQIYFAQQNWALSFEQFKQYIDIAIYELPPYAYAARALINAKQYEEAGVFSTDLLKIFPSATFAHLTLGESYFYRHLYEQAFIELERAVDMNPSNDNARLLTGLAAYRTQKYESALSQLNIVVQKNPTNMLAQNFKKRTELKLGIESSQTLDDIINNELSLISAPTQLVLELLSKNKLDEASEMLTKIVDNGQLGASNETNVLKLLNSSSTNQVLESLTQEVLEDKDESSTQLAILLAVNHLQQRNIDKALLIAQKLIKDAPSNQNGYIIEMNAHLLAENKELAKLTNDKLLAIAPHHPVAISFLTNLALEAGDTQKALDIAKDSIELRYSNLNSLVQYYMLSKQVGSSDAAISHMQKAYSQNADNIKYAITLANMLGDQRRFESVSELLTPYLSEQEKPAMFWRVLANSYLASSQFDKATDTLKAWQKTNPKDEQTWLTEISLLDFLKRFDASHKVVMQGLRVIPNSSQLMFLNAHYQLMLQGPEIAQKTIESFNDTVQSSRAVQVLLAKTHLKQSNFIKAQDILEAEYKKSMNADVLFGLVAIADFTNNSKQGLALLEEAYNRNPSKKVGHALALKYIDNQPEKAITIYEKMLEEKQASVAALNNYAWALSKAERHTEALAMIDQIIPESMDNIDPWDTKLEILRNLGKSEEITNTLEALSYTKIDIDVIKATKQKYQQ